MPLFVIGMSASASMPRIVVMSWTMRCVSREFVDFERSWESFAFKHGCCEMCTF